MSGYNFSQWPPVAGAAAPPPLGVATPYPPVSAGDAGSAAYAAYAAAYQAQYAHSAGSQASAAVTTPNTAAYPASLYRAATAPTPAAPQVPPVDPTHAYYQAAAANHYAAAYKAAAASGVSPHALPNYVGASVPPIAPVPAPTATPGHAPARTSSPPALSRSDYSISHNAPPSPGTPRHPPPSDTPPRGQFSSRGKWQPRGPPPSDFRPRGPNPRDGPRGGHPPRGFDNFGPRRGGPSFGPRGPPPDREWGPRPRGRWDTHRGPRPEMWEEPRESRPNRFSRNRGGSRGWRSPPREPRPPRRPNERPPSLMSEDFDPRKIDQNERPRKRRFTDNSDEQDRHSKRHVDEDLNVTISSNDRDEENGIVKYYCTVCRKNIKKGYEFQQHLRGRRHKEKLAKQSAEGAGNNEEGEDLPRGLRQGVKLITDKDIPLDATLTLMPLDDHIQLKLFCVKCRVALLTEENKLCHDWSPTHLKRVQEVDAIGDGKSEDQSLCEVCAELYTTSEEAEHKVTERHEENMHWRLAVCDICVCKYNDISSLEKHFLTSRHIRQLEKVRRTGMEPEALKNFFANVNSQLAVKRASFCLICTTSCGTEENLEIHNIVTDSYHKKMAAKAAKAREDQFYCYCCDIILNESDRRFHGKSVKHRTMKGTGRNFKCEDCDVRLDEEHKLSAHLKSKSHFRTVDRRKALQDYAKNKFIVEWKEEQSKAAQFVADHYKDKENNKEETTAEGSESNTTGTESKLVKPNTNTDVIPIAGDFCTICSQFFQFDTPDAELCHHVQKSKGIHEVAAPKESKDNDLADTGGTTLNDEFAVVDEAPNTEDGVDSVEGTADTVEEAEDSVKGAGDCVEGAGDSVEVAVDTAVDDTAADDTAADAVDTAVDDTAANDTAVDALEISTSSFTANDDGKTEEAVGETEEAVVNETSVVEDTEGAATNDPSSEMKESPAADTSDVTAADGPAAAAQDME